jgi:hypothetical protein
VKYGLEQEFFVAKRVLDGQLIYVGGLDATLTPDECGFLAEARGQPYGTIREAVFSLMADVYRLEQAANKLGLELVEVPNATVPEAEILKSRRQFSKGVLSYQNLYGHEAHRNGRKKTAGIHISFTKPKVFTYSVKDGANPDEEDRYTERFEYQPLWDFVQVFRKLDKAFEKEIKEARRNPGFYELKPDGRIEYRSLPNNVDLKKIIDVIEQTTR